MNIKNIIDTVVFGTLPSMVDGVEESATYKHFLEATYDNANECTVNSYTDYSGVTAIKIDDTIRPVKLENGSYLSQRVKIYLVKKAQMPSDIVPSEVMGDLLEIDDVQMHIIQVEPLLSDYFFIYVES